MGTDASSLSSEDTKGIIPRALNQIVGKMQPQSCDVSVSFQEIYIDSIKDLLDPNNKMTQINQALSYEPTQVKIKDQQQVFHLLKKSEANRTVACTAANERSSRSHSILQITIPFEDRKATLFLVDLAGSGLLNTTKVECERLKETQAIN